MANGSEIIHRMALDALNACKRDRDSAVKLLKQQIRESDALVEMLADTAIQWALAQAVSRDIRQERVDVLREERAKAAMEAGAAVGGAGSDPRPVRLPAIPPHASPEAVERRAARVIKHMGLFGLPLPDSNKVLGEAKAWEVKDASIYHLKRGRADLGRAEFYGFVWQALPDRNKPADQQKPTSKHLDLKTLRRMDTKAQITVAKQTLSPLAEARS